MKQITGADLFVKALKEEAVDTLFSKVFGVTIIDYDGVTVLLECTQTKAGMMI